MKASNYNYEIVDNDSVIFFNGITESSFRTSKKNASSFSTIINNPEPHYDTFKDFIDKMIAQGFIIDESADETQLIREKYDALRKPRVYSIMILPTYQCNLRCWYCIQDHANDWMSDEDIQLIKARLTKMANNQEIEHLNISWFGGEPMLAFDKVLSLTQWTSQLAASTGKGFNATITTNGTLLNEKRIIQLKEAGVDHYQITIDGNREVHNKVKCLNRISAFDKTLENIGHIIKHSSCTLRFNYTKDNLSPESIIKDVDAALPKEGREKMSFLVYKVWQEDESAIPDGEVEKLTELACSIGLRPRLAVGGMCYADNNYFECVFTNGKVGKCDNENPDAGIGRITADGDIIWEGDISSHLGIMDNEKSECNNCRYLPMCWGPCSSKRKGMLMNEGLIRCQFADKEREMGNSIKNARKNEEFINRMKHLQQEAN